MEAAPPNEFKQHLAKWVYNRSQASIVIVTFDPKDPQKVKEHIDQMYPDESQTTRARMADERKELSAQLRCATGFVVQENSDHLLVLTCAHSLDHVFTDSYSITRAEIRKLFNCCILCDHAEARYRLDEQAGRQEAKASVEQVDCHLDLLLLKVNLSSLRKCCEDRHPALAIAKTFPESLEKVVILSWPPYRPRTACVGVTSHDGRDYSEVFDENLYEYSMKLSEVSVLADSGSSGAPMLDASADVVGVLHGGAKSSLCYFISLEVLRNALMAWGVI